MTMQFSTALRNARLDLIESAIGASAVLKFTTSGDVVLSTITLPADWMAAASGGTKVLSGTWQDTSADATGTAAKFFLYASDGITLYIQGTVSMAGGGGDMILVNTSIAVGQTVTVTGFTLTEGNA
jgi:hypothetical protein